MRTAFGVMRKRAEASENVRCTVGSCAAREACADRSGSTMIGMVPRNGEDCKMMSFIRLSLPGWWCPKHDWLDGCWRGRMIARQRNGASPDP